MAGRHQLRSWLSRAVAVAVAAAAICAVGTPAGARPAPTIDDLIQQRIDAYENLLVANRDLAGTKSELDTAAARDQAAKADAGRAASAEQATKEASDAAQERAGQRQAMVDGYAYAGFTSPARSMVLPPPSGENLGAYLSAASLADYVFDIDGRKLATLIRDAGTARSRYENAVAAYQSAQDQSRSAGERLFEAQRRYGEATRHVADAAAGVVSADQRLAVATAVPDGVPDGSAAEAVRFALRQLGKPYEWGAAGPQAFDCSGLVVSAYRTVGVVLPRTSADQSTVGAAVAREDVQAGDLIFYYQPVSHVAIAVDGQWAVHAPTFGTPVEVSAIDAIGPVTVIRRVTP